MTFMTAIFIAFISLMALVVLHEFSHLIVAKKFSVPVEEFGIGYPPRLWGKKIGATLYSLNLLPFGAFVKIKDEDFNAKPIWQRSLIVLAGIVSFWLIAALLFMIIFGLTVPWDQAIVRGLDWALKVTFLIIRGLGQVLVNALARRPLGAELVGPIGILDVFRRSGVLGTSYFLQTVALVSLHVAIFNALPIPVTDGGKLLFLGIEKARGRPLSSAIEQKINIFFFALLISLMVWVTAKDINRLF